MSRNILVHLAYDGTDFRGYQIQAKGERTVQGVVEAALARLHGHPVTTCAAGRTDSGVHADAQYINFETDLDNIPGETFYLALNRELPPDCKGQSSREVEDSFHARFSAVERGYRYYTLISATPVPKYRNYAHRLSWMPDLDALNQEAGELLGSHDFALFAAAGGSGESTVREVRAATFTWEPPFVVFSIRANGFLRKMVRSVLGTLLDREDLRRRGAAARHSITELLEIGDRRLAGPTAPPEGLFLTDVRYDV
ncbi:MAG: tRNA pseudouridine(38-40) synthase TruA [Alkalispirochaetaceae bacterium]